MHSFVIPTGLAMHKLTLSVRDIDQLNIVELKQKYREVCSTPEIELCQYCTLVVFTEYSFYKEKC